MTTRDTILAKLQLAERDEESIPLGATIRMRELTRAQFRDAGTFATTEDALGLERLRAGQLVAAIRAADGDAEAIEDALTVFALGAPASATDADRWHAALIAASAHDPETGEVLFTRDEILEWPDRADVWNEVRRLAQVALNVSHATVDALKNESAPSSPATE